MPPKKLVLLTLSRSVAVVALLCAMHAILAQDAKLHKPLAAQPNDEVYTRLIHDYLSDPRFTTELVDHLPASATVPTPLKFLGTMPGQPGELYYSEDINRYFEALAKASPRAKFWKLPRKSEEGREMVVLAIGTAKRRLLTSISTRPISAHSAIRARQRNLKPNRSSTPRNRSTG